MACSPAAKSLGALALLSLAYGAAKFTVWIAAVICIHEGRLLHSEGIATKRRCRNCQGIQRQTSRWHKTPSASPAGARAPRHSSQATAKCANQTLRRRARPPAVRSTPCAT